MKAKKTESRSKLARPPKAVQWRSSEVFHLRSMLAHVQSKLDRIHVLGPRLAVEAPEMQVGDLISRLRERKNELITKISEEDKKILKKRPKSGGVPKGGGGAYAAEQYIPSPEDMDAWLRSKMDSWAGKPPNYFGAGVVAPDIWREKAYEKLRLHHNSEASYHAGFGVERNRFNFHGTLYDDAAWYRDDNPDCASWGSELVYRIPPPDRDAIVHVRFDISVSTDFLNAADDGGLLVHSVVINYTDPDGEWPPWPVGLYSEVEPQQVVILATHTDYHSGFFPPRRTFWLDFETKRNRQPAIFVLFVTHLRAQDGEVDAHGWWYVPPEMHYYFTRP